MSTKEEVSPTDECIFNKDFPDGKELIIEEESDELITEEDCGEIIAEEESKDLIPEEENKEDTEEMSNSLVGKDNDSALKTNMEEVEEVEVVFVEDEVFVAVDASEVDPLERGEEFEKCARRKKVEKLKGQIERVKQNLKDGEKIHQVPRHRFRPSVHPGVRPYPGPKSPPKRVEIEEPAQIEKESSETCAKNSLQSVESKEPFPMWPEAVGGAVEASQKERKEMIRQFRVMRALRRYNLPTETAIGHSEEEVFPDEGKASNVEEEATSEDVEKMKMKTNRCSLTDCKKKIGLTGFPCRCRLFFCPLHR